MKRIYLVRHAKSSWKKALPDHLRPLKKRGRKDAKKVGKYLRERGFVPSVIVSSDATRAIETAEILSETLNIEEPPALEANLYESGVEEYLRVLAKSAEELDSVMIVGHNPTITDTAFVLTGEKIYNWMKTSSVAVLDCAVESWRELSPYSCKTVELITPKDMD